MSTDRLPSDAVGMELVVLGESSFCVIKLELKYVVFFYSYIVIILKVGENTKTMEIKCYLTGQSDLLGLLVKIQISKAACFHLRYYLLPLSGQWKLVATTRFFISCCY